MRGKHLANHRASREGSQSGVCSTEALRALAALVLVLGSAQTGRSQMTLGGTTGVLPVGPYDRSLILGDDLAAFQQAWLAPLSADQQLWVNNVAAVANQVPSSLVPGTFAAAAQAASIAQSAGLRYALTGQASDLAKAVSALVVADVPPPSANSFIIRPEVLTSYLSAYDFIRGAPAADLAPATRSTIETRLLALAQSLDNGNNTLSNARGKIGATRGLAGVLLGDQALLDEGLTDLEGHLGYSTTDDGWFTDSQGHYLNYTLRHVGLFARAYEQGSGVDLFPALVPYYETSLGLRLPDGTVPNVSNGLVSPVATHTLMQTGDDATRARLRWSLETTTPNPFPWTNTNLTNNDNTYASSFALADLAGVAATAPTQSPTYFAPGQSQVTVFRENWGNASDYLALSPGIDSPAIEFSLGDPPQNFIVPAFHSHNDTQEILLAARGKYLLVAPGYERTDLSNSPAGFAPKRADWHNVVLVDGDVGAPGEGRSMRPDDFVASQRLDSRELSDFAGVSDFSTLATRYAGVDVTRSIAFPGEDYFVVADRLDGDASHNYGFNLVGRGVQTVLTNSPGLVEVSWQHDGAQVIEHLVSSGTMTLATASLAMHVTFNDFETTQRMQATIAGTDELFLSVLETGAAGDAPRLSLTTLAAPAGALAVEVTSLDGWRDTIVSQLVAGSVTVGDLQTDGNYAWFRDEAGQVERLMWAGGTRIAIAGGPWVESNAPVTASAWFQPEEIRSTIEAELSLPQQWFRYASSRAALAATLDGAPVPFVNHAGYVEVTLDRGGLLVVTLVPEPSAGVLAVLGAAALGLVARRRKDVLPAGQPGDDQCDRLPDRDRPGHRRLAACPQVPTGSARAASYFSPARRS